MGRAVMHERRGHQAVQLPVGDRRWPQDELLLQVPHRNLQMKVSTLIAISAYVTTGMPARSRPPNSSGAAEWSGHPPGRTPHTGDRPRPRACSPGRCTAHIGCNEGRSGDRGADSRSAPRPATAVCWDRSRHQSCLFPRPLSCLTVISVQTQSGGVDVERYLEFLAAHDWDGLATTIADEGLVREGPFCDLIEGKAHYLAYLRKILHHTQGPPAGRHSGSRMSTRRVSFVELTESFEIDGTPAAWPECLLFEQNDDGLISHVSVFFKQRHADTAVEVYSLTRGIDLTCQDGVRRNPGVGSGREIALGRPDHRLWSALHSPRIKSRRR